MPTFNPSLPLANSQVSSSELRDQLNGLKGLIDALPTSAAMTNAIVNNSAAPIGVTQLGLTVSNPPTQAQVQAIVTKLNELINALELRS